MEEKKICPSCNKNELDPIDIRNALSRKDNKTYICGMCGLLEAVEDIVKNI